MEDKINTVSGKRYFLAGMVKGFGVWLLLWVISGWAAGSQYKFDNWLLSALFFMLLFGFIDVLDKKYAKLSLVMKFLIFVVVMVVWYFISTTFFPSLSK